MDTLGPHTLADRSAPVDVQRYQILTALQLSSQTRDQVTAAAMERLKAHGLTAERIRDTSQAELEKLVTPVGFYRRKATFMRDTARLILERHGGRVPRTVPELMGLPGIGPKMAHLTLLHAYDEVDGIGVDTHVHRICNQLRWVRSTTPEQTRVQLQAWLPREEWDKLNHELVGLGQMIQQPEFRGELLKAVDAMPAADDRRGALLLLRRLGLKALSVPRRAPGAEPDAREGEQGSDDGAASPRSSEDRPAPAEAGAPPSPAPSGGRRRASAGGGGAAPTPAKRARR